MSIDRFPLVILVPLSPNGSRIFMCIVYPSCVCVSVSAIPHPASFHSMDIRCPVFVFPSRRAYINHPGGGISCQGLFLNVPGGVGKII